jgi:hypothetical protein
VYFYDKSGKQVEHMYIQHLSFKDLLGLLKARGFEHSPGSGPGDRTAKASRQPVNALEAYMRNTSTPFTRMHRLNNIRGTGGQTGQPSHTTGTLFGRRLQQV